MAAPRLPVRTMREHHHRGPLLLLVSALAVSHAVTAAGQASEGGERDLRYEATAGSDVERYLRALQVAGRAPLYPWGLRALAPREVDILLAGAAPHPWEDRLGGGEVPPARARIRAVRPLARTVYHTALPGEGNDGPVWTSRGVTVVASGGALLAAGPLTLRVEPVAFWTENRAFPLRNTPFDDERRFAHPDGRIDLPQRFGQRAMARLHPGQSTLRLDVLGVVVGISTANQVWGPAEDLPLVLGTRGEGFPHLLAGTSTPVGVGIGSLHGRLVWGDLAQSRYSPVAGHGSRRFMTGIVGTFTPRGAEGLELGLTRFFHNAWPAGGVRLRDFLQPLEAFLKSDLGDDGDGPTGRQRPDNQLASVFARWVLPRGGAEVYGEYAREDHAWDLRDLLLEPDHQSAYMLGVRHVWSRGSGLLSARAELVESQQSHLLQVRAAHPPMYLHSPRRQGHTVGGQLLGSPAALGGGGSVVAVEAFLPRGRWSVDWTRTRLHGAHDFSVAPPPPDSAGVAAVHSFGVEGVVFRRGVDFAAGLRGSLRLDHELGDRFDLGLVLGVRAGT
jgi:hypothetical protein